MDHSLPRRTALLLFAIVVVIWGLNWAVTKTLVESVYPLWATAIRTAIAAATLFLVQLARGQLIVPRRGDLGVIVAIGLLHMVAFSALTAFGLKFAPVGRSVVLGYTTPLWVACPCRPVSARADHAMAPRRHCTRSARQSATLLNPFALDWNDRDTLIGSGLILLAAMCWAANILYVRAHKWVSTPFQLTLWQALLACIVLTTLAAIFDGAPQIAWSPRLVGAFLYSAVLGTALAYWAMAMVNRSLPAATTSLGILATPVVGVISSTIALGETVDISLLAAMAMILSGVAIGTIPAADVSSAVSRDTPRRSQSRGTDDQGAEQLLGAGGGLPPVSGMPRPCDQANSCAHVLLNVDERTPAVASRIEPRDRQATGRSRRFTQDGTLVATVAQEGLIRQKRPI